MVFASLPGRAEKAGLVLMGLDDSESGESPSWSAYAYLLLIADIFLTFVALFVVALIADSVYRKFIAEPPKQAPGQGPGAPNKPGSGAKAPPSSAPPSAAPSGKPSASGASKSKKGSKSSRKASKSKSKKSKKSKSKKSKKSKKR